MHPAVRTPSIGARNLYDLFREATQLHADRVALKGEGGKGQCFTYREMDAAVRRVSEVLGPLADPYIGLVSENCPEWPIAYLAILATGKTVIPIDARLKSNEISHILKHSGAKTVLASEGQFEVVRGIDPGLRVLRLIPFEEKESHLDQRLSELTLSIDLSREAVLIYTSGTTGDPKAVVLTHGNLLANLDGIESSLQFKAGDVFLSILPLHHTFEATCGFLTPIMNGCTIVYARSLKSRDILDDLAANSVTIMCGVPLLFEKMHHAMERGIEQAPLLSRLSVHALYSLSRVGGSLGFKWGKGLFASLRKKAGLSSIRMFVSGGAVLPKSISEFFNLIGIDFLQGYGLTECSPVVAVNRPDDNRFGSVGPPLSNVELRIDQPNPDGIGEICVRGASITPGYKGNVSATAKLLQDGWLHTGDLGRISKGHLWITGRAKNVIISAAGKNIYPEELEELLLSSQYILEAVVVGRYKSGGKQGEEVFAVIVPDMDMFKQAIECGILSGETIHRGISEVVAEVNGHVADYKRIAGFEISMNELEKTSTKKVKRFLYTK